MATFLGIRTNFLSEIISDVKQDSHKIYMNETQQSVMWQIIPKGTLFPIFRMLMDLHAVTLSKRKFCSFIGEKLFYTLHMQLVPRRGGKNQQNRKGMAKISL